MPPIFSLEKPLVPELPEVETTLRGISPYIVGFSVISTIVRNHRLRYAIDPQLAGLLNGRIIHKVTRRGKYLLFEIGNGHLLLHLGMSGSLRLVEARTAPEKHDHVDLVLSSGLALRFTDPRRFGLILWLETNPEEHFLLHHLGPEPLSDSFNRDYLFKCSRGRTLPIKSLLMDSKIVVGVGNIYANEALFHSGIHPSRPAGKISKKRYATLIIKVQKVLASAIAQGGTTLKDFVGSDGKPGYFSQSLQVYGRANLPCTTCGQPLKEIRIAQRATVFCTRCQH